jgi:RNA polymerase sigma-70 factor, ECF subfamily
MDESSPAPRRRPKAETMSVWREKRPHARALPAAPQRATIRGVHPPERLSATFRATAAHGAGDCVGDDVLEPALRAYVDAARAAWPDFGIEPEEIVSYVASRTPAGKLPDPAYAADLLLACACARGTSAAIGAFHRHHGTVIARVLSRRRASADLADDATQAVFERLLIAPPGRSPKIGEYRGTGPLRSWVATAAATTLMMMRRAAGRRREEPPDSGISLGLAVETDPELRYIKERYRAEMEGAVSLALDRLGDRERTLLRLHLTERMSIDQLGVMYGINRATAARWLAAARAAVLTGAREELRTRLRLSPSEWGSVVALVRSQLNVSIARHLS